MHVCATDPYPWPYDGSLAPQRTALVLCGAQRGAGRRQPGRAASCSTARRASPVPAPARGAGGVGAPRRRTPRRGRRRAPGARHAPAWELAATPDAADVIVDAGGWDGSFASDLDDVLRAGADPPSCSAAWPAS